MNEWWTALTLAQQIFYFIAIISSFVLLIQIVFSFIGFAGGDLDMDGIPDDMEMPHDIHIGDIPHDIHIGDVPHDIHVGDVPHDMHIGDVDQDVGPFSVRTILAFLVGFGWGGVAVLGSGASPVLAVVAAIFIGGVFMMVVFLLLRWMMSMAVSGNISITNAVGQTGTVYIPIPAHGSSSGQVQVNVQGRLREVPAITDEAQPLSTGTHIRVVQVVDDDVLLVRPTAGGAKKDNA